MNYSFELREEATKEFIEAFVWYEEQREGLGNLFKNSFDKKLKQICNAPFHYKISHKNLHEALTDKFPYLIVYKVDEKAKHITIMAIFHTSRNPKKKVNRT